MQKTATAVPIRRYLIVFTLWLVCFAALYFVLFPFYGKLVLFLSGAILDIFTTTDVSLFDVPGQGIALTYPGALGPIGFRQLLSSIALNLMFAPALVLTTLGLSLHGALRAAIAIAIMGLLHSLHVSVIVLHFLTQAPHLLISENFPEILATAIHWSYSFADKMGYTLFPFIAWFAVCAPAIFRRLRNQTQTQTKQLGPIDVETQK